MLPQFNTIWFANQIFWFGISFSGFALLSFKFIIPLVTSFYKAREEKIRVIIEQANKMVSFAEIIKREVADKIALAQNEAIAIIYQAKKQSQSDASNFNQEAIQQIELYRQQKNQEIKHDVIKKNLYLLSSVNNLTSEIAKKAGIQNFILQTKKIDEIKNNLNI